MTIEEQYALVLLCTKLEASGLSKEEAEVLWKEKGDFAMDFDLEANGPTN